MWRSFYFFSTYRVCYIRSFEKPIFFPIDIWLRETEPLRRDLFFRGLCFSLSCWGELWTGSEDCWWTREADLQTFCRPTAGLQWALVYFPHLTSVGRQVCETYWALSCTQRNWLSTPTHVSLLVILSYLLSYLLQTNSRYSSGHWFTFQQQLHPSGMQSKCALLPHSSFNPHSSIIWCMETDSMYLLFISWKIKPFQKWTL